MGPCRARPERRKEHWKTGRQRDTASKKEAEALIPGPSPSAAFEVPRGTGGGGGGERGGGGGVGLGERGGGGAQKGSGDRARVSAKQVLGGPRKAKEP